MLGHLAEKHMSKTNLRTSVLITVIAWLVYLVAWSFLFTQYVEVTYQLSQIPEAPNIPAYVPVTLFVMFVMFSSFGLVQLVQWAGVMMYFKESQILGCDPDLKECYENVDHDIYLTICFS